jgi:hypothetical protein
MISCEKRNLIPAVVRGGTSHPDAAHQVQQGLQAAGPAVRLRMLPHVRQLLRCRQRLADWLRLVLAATALQLVRSSNLLAARLAAAMRLSYAQRGS